MSGGEARRKRQHGSKPWSVDCKLVSAFLAAHVKKVQHAFLCCALWQEANGTRLIRALDNNVNPGLSRTPG